MIALFIAAMAASQPASEPFLLDDAQTDLGGQGLPKLHLRESVDRALTHNPTALIAGAEIRRAEALLRQAISFALPTLSVGGQYTRLDNDRALNGTVILGKDQLSGNALLSVPLLVPARWGGWYRASAQVDATKVSEEEVKRTVAVATVRAYFTVMAHKRVIEGQARALQFAKVYRGFAQKRFEKGLGSKLDEMRSERELRTVEAQLQGSYTQLARAREALGVLVGLDSAVEVYDNEDLGAPQPLKDALDAIEKRQDVRAAKARLDAADKGVKSSFTDYLPTLVGTFQPFYQNPPSLTQPLFGWQLFLLANWNIFDGGLRYGQGRERKAQATVSELQFEATHRQALSDVRAAYVAYERALQAQKAAHQALDAAVLGLKLADSAYRTGVMTGLELVDAQRSERDASTFAVSADDTARQAALDALAASGAFP